MLLSSLVHLSCSVALSHLSGTLLSSSPRPSRRLKITFSGYPKTTWSCCSPTARDQKLIQMNLKAKKLKIVYLWSWQYVMFGYLQNLTKVHHIQMKFTHRRWPYNIMTCHVIYAWYVMMGHEVSSWCVARMVMVMVTMMMTMTTRMDEDEEEDN